MSYIVKIDQFEGPLDLLLHLISKSKVRIEDVSITQITEQYLEALDSLEQFNIEIASEFLVMAATLLHIKSCMLIPKTKPSLENDEDNDPGQELITRLKEYKMFKEAGAKLRERERYFSGVFYKHPEKILAEFDREVFPEHINAELLKEIFIQLINIKKNNVEQKLETKLYEIERDTVTIQEKASLILDILDKKNEFTFFSIFDQHHSHLDIIITFLALLDLLKENKLDVWQNTVYGDIRIKRRINYG